MHFAVIVALASFSGIVRASELEKRTHAKIVTTCTKPKTFAFTFDDGPYVYEAKLDKVLKEYGAKATFFVNGNNWDCIYDVAEELQQTYLAGHLIGSHTWEHVDITTLTGPELVADLERVEVALKKILGIKPKFFRPPYGNYNQAQLDVLASRGYTSIYWSFDSGDSTGSSVKQSEAAYAKLAKSYPKPEIPLNHETYASTVNDVAPYALKLMKSKGYELVTIADCLGLEPYQDVYTKTLPKRDSSWHC